MDDLLDRRAVVGEYGRVSGRDGGACGGRDLDRDLAQQAVCREGIRVILRAKNVLLPSV